MILFGVPVEFVSNILLADGAWHAVREGSLRLGRAVCLVPDLYDTEAWGATWIEEGAMTIAYSARFEDIKAIRYRAIRYRKPMPDQG